MGLTFRHPDFGNRLQINNEAVVRRNMGGESQVIVDPNWPVYYRMTYTISALNEVARNSFIAFYEATAGQEIVFTDHENVAWRGYIVTPQPQLLQYGNGCAYRTSFDFEGVKA